MDVNEIVEAVITNGTLQLGAFYYKDIKVSKAPNESLLWVTHDSGQITCKDAALLSLFITTYKHINAERETEKRNRIIEQMNRSLEDE